jgi:uncharacterized SAM-binding protein YcdF (DUF218 family)
MAFLYSLTLKLLYPTSLCAMLLLAAAAFRKRERLSRVCLWAALGVLMICGNGWVVGGLTKHLEHQYPPLDSQPFADCIVVLDGATRSRIPPRPTIEVGAEGDRVLYGWRLYRQGCAPLVICTGGVATGQVAPRPGSEDMADMLEDLRVPRSALLTETNSANTHEHARNLGPVFKQRNIQRVLLVTSAMHLPRALGVFRKNCSGIELIPAPTDFRCVEKMPHAWYRELPALVPTPEHLLAFSDVMHEYLGMAYYRLRGWL